MTPVSKEAIAAAVDILGTEGISSDDVESQVRALVADSMTARRLIDWIPEVFGMVLVSHLGSATLPTTFSAKSSTGNWEEFPFSSEPIFEVALKIAQPMFHNGPRSIFKNISVRSAVLGAANRALDAGRKIDGAKIGGPALLGIPAEVYHAKKRSF